MRQLLLITFLMLCLSSEVFAQGQFAQTLGRMETSIFGVEYSKQNDTTRLSRLEENVYGQTLKGSVKERINRLSKDISADVIGQEISPTKDTFAENEEYKEQELKADESVDYPIVNEMEMQIFKKEFKNLDISTRLSKIEKQTFKMTFEKEDLNTRMERLKNNIAIQQKQEKLSYESPSDNYYTPAETDNYYSSADTDNYDPFGTNRQNYFENSKNIPQNDNNFLKNRDMRASINKIEKSVFNESFSSDTVDNRLSRLESKLFKTNFSDDSETMRLSRLESATKAQKSAKKYDNNNFAQKMTSVLQVGMMVLMIVAMVL